ncbi:MAG: hypothetical protein ACI9ES_003199 [Oceanospirillaceae bacterium]|jgi:hypothetical protein
MNLTKVFLAQLFYRWVIRVMGVAKIKKIGESKSKHEYRSFYFCSEKHSVD